MRRLQEKRTFRVEVAPGVWRDIGAVPGDIFKRIQAELENVAELAGVMPESNVTHRLRNVIHTVVVDGFEGAYEVDTDRLSVRLVSVYRSARRR